MEITSGNTCGRCGFPVEGDDSFCGRCGFPVAGTENETIPEALPLSSSRRNSRKRYLLFAAIAGGLALAVGVVVMTLFLTIWKDEGGGADSPEDLVAMYMNSLEQDDLEAYMDCFEFEHFEDMWGKGISVKVAKFMLKGFFSLCDIRFENVEPRIVSSDDKSVKMKADQGIIVTTDFFMDIDYDLSGDPIYFKMYERNGKWYLSADPMKGTLAPGPNP